jgi:hypothetical protein
MNEEEKHRYIRHYMKIRAQECGMISHNDVMRMYSSALCFVESIGFFLDAREQEIRDLVCETHQLLGKKFKNEDGIQCSELTPQQEDDMWAKYVESNGLGMTRADFFGNQKENKNDTRKN